MVAIGYSLGLAGSVLWLGALGDRYGRKTDGAVRHGAVDPGLPRWPRGHRRSACSSSPGSSAGCRPAWRTRPRWRSSPRCGPPAPSRTKSIAMWSAIGGGFSALGSAGVRIPARALLVGLGVPDHAAARRTGAGARRRGSCRPTSTSRPIRSTISVASCRCSPSCDRARDQLPAGPDSARSPRSCSCSVRRCSACCSTSASVVPDFRSTTSIVAARRLFWVAGARRHHRVRLADGRDVHRSAVPAERARLRHARSRCGDPARRVHDGPRRAAVGQARPVARIAVHAAARLRVLSARLRHDARPVGRGHRLLGRSRWRTR